MSAHNPAPRYILLEVQGETTRRRKGIVTLSHSPLCDEILGIVAVPDRQGRRGSIHNSGQLRKHVGKRLRGVWVAPLGQFDD